MLIYEIPIIAIIFLVLGIGGQRPGSAIRTVGGILLVLAAVSFLISAIFKNKQWAGAGILLALNGAIILLLGIFMGDKMIFEFLFGI